MLRESTIHHRFIFTMLTKNDDMGNILRSRRPKNCKRLWTRATPKSWWMLSTMPSCTKSIKRQEILTEILAEMRLIDSSKLQLAGSWRPVVSVVCRWWWKLWRNALSCHSEVFTKRPFVLFFELFAEFWWILSNLGQKPARWASSIIYQDAGRFCRILEALQGAARDQATEWGLGLSFAWNLYKMRSFEANQSATSPVTQIPIPSSHACWVQPRAICFLGLQKRRVPLFCFRDGIVF